MVRASVLSLAVLCLINLSSYRHDVMPLKIRPHRQTGTDLPRPNFWYGSLTDFDPVTWQHGAWQHAEYDSRMGWWWVVDTHWHYFDAPVYPYPDLYTPPGEQFGWWYWCDPYEDYYPYVTQCPFPWESVMPRE